MPRGAQNRKLFPVKRREIHGAFDERKATSKCVEAWPATSKATAPDGGEVGTTPSQVHDIERKFCYQREKPKLNPYDRVASELVSLLDRFRLSPRMKVSAGYFHSPGIFLLLNSSFDRNDFSIQLSLVHSTLANAAQISMSALELEGHLQAYRNIGISENERSAIDLDRHSDFILSTKEDGIIWLDEPLGFASPIALKDGSLGAIQIERPCAHGFTPLFLRQLAHQLIGARSDIATPNPVSEVSELLSRWHHDEIGCEDPREN